MPSVLIPYPFAAEDHQTANAQIFVRAGAGVMVKESEATGDSLAAQITTLLDAPEQLAAMSQAARALAPGNAAETVAETILGFCK